MDQMKKLVSARLRQQPAGLHPDADLLSAFAERALSDVERKQVLDHVGSCSECRETLYLAFPEVAETQNVLTIRSRRSFGFALRWGTLAVVIAAGATLFVATRNRNSQLVSEKTEAVKAVSPGATSAELKTPRDIREMHALSESASSKLTASRQMADKIIPTPKHMTAKPAAQFDFDQSGQVRVATGSQTNNGSQISAEKSLALNGRSFVGLQKLDSGAPASPSVATNAVGGPEQDNSAVVFRSAAGAGSGVLGKLVAQGSLGGTVLDASGAVVPNATVTTVGPVGTRVMQSDSQGRFSFAHLAPGSYSVKAQASGFQLAEIPQVAVAAEKPLDLQMRLQVGRSSAMVEVSAAAVQPEVTTVGGLMAANEKQTAELRSLAPQSSSVAQNLRQDDALDRKKTAAPAAAANQPLPAAMPQWTLASDGTLQRSLDFGKSWQAIPVLGASGFRALSANGAHVWVGGNAGALYHSADSGQTWTRVTPTIDGRKLEADIKQVDFSDAQNGTVTAANGEVWSTSNGGQSWTAR
jgi:carboxypeptidase family protein/photosynthesis system II assembly factor YCF48-like protein/putative zinc finger protein